MEETFRNTVEDGLNTNHVKESPKCVYLFNCDKTYNLDSVETLLRVIKDDISRKLSIDTKLTIRKNYFSLSKMSEMSETTIPKLQMDFAVFVIHAHESRLSINEDNAGIGYAKIYRALLKATGENVLIVIGGDDQYSNTNEEERCVISRWARRKISSQFEEEFMDGRKSFIFSWNKKHREIHEEALLHYFDPSKKGQKFEYQPKSPSKVSTSDKDSESENKNKPGESDQVQEVKDNSDQHAESSSSIEKNREVPALSATPGKIRDVEDDKVLSERETQLHSLSDYVILKQEEHEEKFEVIRKSEIETLLVKTHLRYGQLSKSDKDTMIRNKQWTPPDELLSDISDRFKDVAEADLEIYRMEETGVIRVKITKNSFIYAIVEEVVSGVITRITDNTRQLIQWARGAEAVVAGQTEEVCRCQNLEEQAPEMSAMSEQKPDVEDDEVMSKKETQSHSLSDHKIVPDKQEEREEEFEVGIMKVQPEIETPLLKTRLRYGQLSESDKDTMVRNKQWTPPDELLSDISDRLKDVAEADLEIYRVEETGVIRVISGVIAWIINNIRQLIQEERGPEAEVTEEIDEFAVVDFKNRE